MKMTEPSPWKDVPDTVDEPINYWQSIPHKTLLQQLSFEAKSLNWILEDFQCFIVNNDKDMVAFLRINGVKLHSLQAIIGILNTNSRRLPLRLYLGVHLGELQIFLEELTLAKHTKKIQDQLPLRFLQALNLVHLRLNIYQSEIELYQKTLIHMEEAIHLSVLAAKEELIPWSRLKLINNYCECEQVMSFLSAWNLYCGFASAIQRNPLIMQMEQNYKFGRLILNYLSQKKKG